MADQNSKKELHHEKRAIIIDGHALVFRAYFGSVQLLKYIKEHENVLPANAIKISMLMLLKLLSKKRYKYGLIAFDAKGINFRKAFYDEYKSNRTHKENMLYYQIEMMIHIAGYFGLKIFCDSHFEADDFCGSGAKFFDHLNIKCDVFSGDFDFLQLVSPNVTFYKFEKGVSKVVEYNHDNFASLNEGLSPVQIIYLKALYGDVSDNVRGVKGIGKKTAIKLLQQYQTIDNIYNNIDKLSPTLKTKLIEGKNDLEMSQKLVTIVTDLFEINKFQLDEFLLSEPNFEKINEVIDYYKFDKKSFVKYLKN